MKVTKREIKIDIYDTSYQPKYLLQFIRNGELLSIEKQVTKEQLQFLLDNVWLFDIVGIKQLPEVDEKNIKSS